MAWKQSALSSASMLALGLLATAGAANAQENPTVVQEIVVTGSFIAGTPEDAALPVDVISADDLEKQGSPTVVQLVKSITAGGSAIGEGNRYAGGTGTASVNLRGFGSSRTLVLMNGRRLVDAPVNAAQGGGADLNSIPSAAIGRVEVLRDGAAATYGSDAVGGVVNFITRKDLDTLEIDAEYAFIDGSDGDYGLNIAFGQVFERGNLLLTGGYRTRSRLDIRDREWAIQPFESAEFGGWSGAGNPGFYLSNNVAGSFLFRDNGCEEMGGVLTGASAISAVCRIQITTLNDLVNEEHYYQLYAETNYELSDNLEFHAEAAWTRVNVPDVRISPSNLSTQHPTPVYLGGTSNSLAVPRAPNNNVRYNIPAYHPGLTDLRTTCAAPLTAAQCAAMGSPNGVDIHQIVWRPFGHSGHPTHPDGADHQDVESTSYRISAGLTGRFNDAIGFSTAVTFMEAQRVVNESDVMPTRVQLGLNGWASLSADPGSCAPSERTLANAGNAAVGCYFFNPFTNAVARSAINLQQNPYYRGDSNPAVLNNPLASEWLYGNYTNVSTNQLFVADVVFDGETGLVLGGGPVAWAAGAQWRWNREKREFGGFNNLDAFPCIDSVDDGTPVCSTPAGALSFFGSERNRDDDRRVWAVFGETLLPLTDDLEVSLAIRHEDYGGGVGSTTNPKISARWQATPWLALRGSASTTFRAPSPGDVRSSCDNDTANLGGVYRSVLTCGNPDLQPETANAYNVGLVLDAGGLQGAIDYFQIDFEGELTTESAARIYSAMFPTATTTANCSNQALASRFTFSNLGCGAGNVLQMRVDQVNGPATKTSGIDARLTYRWNEFLRDDLDWTAGVEATYLLSYERGEFTLNGNPSVVFAAPEDRAGRHDLVGQFFSYPQLRATGFISANNGPLNARWQVRYTEGTRPAFGSPLYDATTDSGPKTDDYWQHDLIVRWETPWDIQITGSVQNVFDADPADAPSQFNYDYTNGNPLGRVFEISLKKQF